jgi:hypothetical protein
VPEETRLFIRSFLFALVVATAYWFVSYDAIGTVLLGGFAAASLTAFALLKRGAPRRDDRPTGSSSVAGGLLVQVRDLIGTAEDPAHERPFEDERGRISVASLAPVLLGIGVAMVALGLIFGVWSVIAGAIPLALGLREWLREVNGELRALAADEEAEAARDGR